MGMAGVLLQRLEKGKRRFIYIWLLVQEPAFRFESPEGKFKKT